MVSKNTKVIIVGIILVGIGHIYFGRLKRGIGILLGYIVTLFLFSFPAPAAFYLALADIPTWWVTMLYWGLALLDLIRIVKKIPIKQSV